MLFCPMKKRGLCQKVFPSIHEQANKKKTQQYPKIPYLSHSLSLKSGDQKTRAECYVHMHILFGTKSFLGGGNK